MNLQKSPKTPNTIKKALRSIWKRSFKYKVSICAIVKDENSYLREWIDYHLKIGIEHFFIYDNDSKVPVASDLADLVQQGIVSVFPIAGKVQQLNAYNQCLNQNGSKSQWIAFLDADEFIVPKSTTGNLQAFLQDYEQFGGVVINWLVFGSNNQLKKQKSQIHAYTKRSLKNNLQNTNFKSIIQPRHVKRPLNPHHFKYKKWKYGVTEHFKKQIESTATHSSDKIQINHYNLRSLEDFQEKIAKSRADNGEYRDMEYFKGVDNSSNVITDETIIELLMIMK